MYRLQYLTIFLYNFIHLFLVLWVFIVAHRLSLVVGSRGKSLVVVGWLLTAVASLVLEHWL